MGGVEFDLEDRARAVEGGFIAWVCQGVFYGQVEAVQRKGRGVAQADEDAAPADEGDEIVRAGVPNTAGVLGGPASGRIAVENLVFCSCWEG